MVRQSISTASPAAVAASATRKERLAAATSQIEAEERIGATDNLEDTELTSALAVEGDPVEDAFLDKGDAETEPDLGGRVKDPI